MVSFKDDKVLRITVFLLFVVLFLGSIYYYQERMLFCDASHIFFEITNRKTLALSYVSRYGAFITQMVPLISAWLHIPIKAALLMYSMSFNLFYLIVAAILLFRFKNTKLGILFALYFVLFVSDTYFWTNNEIHQAMGWCFLLFGIIHNYKVQPKHPLFHFTMVTLLAFLSIFTHPLMLFVFPFLWLFTILEKDLNPYSKKQIILLSSCFVIIFAIKYYTMTTGGYDTQKIHNTTNFSFLDLWNAFSSPMSKVITDKLVKDYFFVLILFILGIGVAIIKRKYKAIVLVTLFVIPYYLAVCLTYTDFQAFYTESEWMPFSIITSALFVYYFTPIIRPQLAAVLLMVVFAIRINFILISANKFEQRKQWVFNTIETMKQQNINKGYVYMNDSLQYFLLINWGGPTESIIASSLKGERPTRTFFVDFPNVVKDRMAKTNKQMMGCFGLNDYNGLNPDYFLLDTVQAYQLVNLKK